MLFVVYIVLLLFLLHSALLMASEEILILVIFLAVFGLCAFFVCLASALLTKIRLRTEGNTVIVSVEKRGILPAAGISLSVSFCYGQTGAGSRSVREFSLPAGTHEIELPVHLPYAGSGEFLLEKCTVTDWTGLFRLPVRHAAGQYLPTDIYPPDGEAEIMAEGNQLTGNASGHARTIERKGDDASETLDIRIYRPGDPISRIHWKLSAKKDDDDLMLREFARENDTQYLFVLEFREKTQEHFDRVVTNYYALASGLAREESGHAALWADREGALILETAEDVDDLENVMNDVFHTYDFLQDEEEEEPAETGYFTPLTGEQILEQYRETHTNVSFVREFLITDEPLADLQRRWASDEA